MSKLLEAVFDEIEFRLARRAAQRANVQKARSKRDRLRREREASEDLLSKGSSTNKEQTLLSRRSAKDNALTTIKLSVIVLLSVCTFGIRANGQQLREVFRNVQQAVVVVRTEQKGLAPFPLQGQTSLKGLGSGVLISKDGKVLTAAHLVESADRTIVEFSGGELVLAHVIGCSISADVAILQLERQPPNYIAAKLGDSDTAEVGDEIFVVGAPYGISRTLTAGHVSGRRILNFETDATKKIEFLQTDAAINQGSSGSPIFNLNGEVVGIVSNIMSKSGGSEGLAFASTSNTARRVLLEHKSFWTGIDGVLIEGNLAKALNLTQPVGLLVQRVAEGSIASRAGIRPGTLRANVEGEEIVLGGDIILRVNDMSIQTDAGYDQIYERIGSNNSLQNLVITVIRAGQILKLAINNSSTASDK